MEQIDGVVGNRHADPALGERVAEHGRAGTLERVRIEVDNRKRSRLRVETDSGTDLGIVLDEPLAAGDVLAIDADRAIIVEFERREAAVVDLPEPTETGVEIAATLGHRVGNQHWDLAVEGGRAYIQTEADRHIIEDVLADSLPQGSTIEYEAVDPALWLDEGETGSSHDGGGHHHGSDGHHHGSHDHSHNGSDSHGTVDYREAQSEGGGDGE